MDMGTKAMSFIGILALAMGGFVIFNTFRTIIAERRRDLGMLRALGATRRTVLALILTESLIQGILGTVLGLVAGYGLAMLFVAAINPVLREFWNRQLGMPPLQAGNLITAAVLGIGITVLSGIMPARAATKVTPLEALRPTTAGMEKLGARRRNIVALALIVIAVLTLFSGNSGLAMLGVLIFFVGLIIGAPALVTPLANVFSRALEVIYAREGNIARGNVVRQPGRAAVTASTVMIALAIVVAMSGLLSSILGNIADYSTKSLGADYLLMPASLVLSGGNVGAGAQLADKMRATEGVGGVTTLRLAMATANNQSLQMIGIDPVSYPQIAGLLFSSGNEQDAYAALGAGRAVIVNGIFASQVKLKVGDSLPLQTAQGVQTYKVVGVGLDYLNAKVATGYISQANLAADFGQTSDILLMANLASGADAGAVRQRLDTLVAAYPVFTLLDSAAFRASQQRMMQGMSWMLSLVLIFLAAPSLIAMINTLAISVIERTREIGMLRAVGSTRKQIGRMIQAESLLLAAIGTAFGIVIGIWLGYALVGAVGSLGFVVTYQFPFAGLLAGIAAGLLLGVLSAVIPARQAAKMDIIEALRYE
jgi:putative ABC transport system permease protein